MSDSEYLVHISELPLDTEKADIENYFKQHGIENVNITIIKQ